MLYLPENCNLSINSFQCSRIIKDQTIKAPLQCEFLGRLSPLSFSLYQEHLPICTCPQQVVHFGLCGIQHHFIAFTNLWREISVSHGYQALSLSLSLHRSDWLRLMWSLCRRFRLYWNWFRTASLERGLSHKSSQNVGPVHSRSFFHGPCLFRHWLLL